MFRNENIYFSIEKSALSGAVINVILYLHSVYKDFLYCQMGSTLLLCYPNIFSDYLTYIHPKHDKYSYINQESHNYFVNMALLYP